MKIIRDENKNTVSFGTLPYGSVFEADKDVFLVIPDVIAQNDDGEDVTRNAFNVIRNRLTYFPAYGQVHPLEAELRIVD